MPRIRALPRAVARSVRARTVLVLLALLALAIGASVLATRAFLLGRLDDRIDRRLAAEVGELRTFASTGVDPATGRPFTDAGALMALAIERSVPDRYETMFSVVDGRPDSRSTQPRPVRLDTDDRLVRAVAGLTAPHYGTVDTARGAVRYAATPVRIGSSSGVYVIAWFRDEDAAEVRSTVQLLAVVGTVAGVLAAILAWFLAGRLLAPLRRLAGTAQRVNERDLDSRVDVRGRDEVSDVARTFNGMLDRVQQGFEAQRRFADDAGHELRTPITIVRGHLELLSADERTRADQRDLMLDELDRMARMVDELLTLSRSGQPDFVRTGSVELPALAGELRAKATALGARDWRFDAAGADGAFVADRQLITQAVLQLVQNAVQHTAAGGRITLTVHASADDVTFAVHDSGPGVPAADREDVFARFARGRDARRAGPGAGLGLAIVRAIADAHGGTARFDEPPDGTGALAVLSVPRTPAGRTP